MIGLEKFHRDFYAELISWVTTEEQLMQFAGPAFNFPLTSEQLDKSLSDKNRFAFRVVNDRTNVSIGHSEIYLTDQSAYLGRILIGDVEQRGKGLGQQIVNLLLNFIFLIGILVQLNATRKLALLSMQTRKAKEKSRMKFGLQ